MIFTKNFVLIQRDKYSFFRDKSKVISVKVEQGTMTREWLEIWRQRPEALLTEVNPDPPEAA